MTAEPMDILLAEDDEEISYLLKYMLMREGFNVAHAPDGKIAKALISQLPPPRLALLDIMMPYFDGYQLIREIRANPAWKAVPIAMLTAKTQKQDVVRAMQLGANGFINKPFQPGELLARLKRIIDDFSTH